MTITLGRQVGALASTLAITALGLTLAAPATAADAVSSRIGGADRWETSALISKETFATGVDVAYLASGVDYPDALAGGAVACHRGAPVLLTKADSIPAAVAAELDRLNPKSIVILGGESAVAASLVAVADAYTDGSVTRIAGENGYATAGALAEASFDAGVDVVFVASGENFPDALGGGAAAAKLGGPVLLTKANALPVETELTLTKLNPDHIVVLGGENAVSKAVLDKLKTDDPAIERLAGLDRFATSAATSAAISADTSTSATTVYIANGLTFPDALSGAPAAASDDAPILLVKSDSVSQAVCDEVNRLQPGNVVALGGSTAVSAAVLTYVAESCLADPTITVEKTNTIGQFADGVDYSDKDTVEYEITVTNNSVVTLSNVTVTEDEFTGTGTLAALECDEDTTLAPSESLTCTVSYDILPGDADLETVTNEASATAVAPSGDIAADSDTDSWTPAKVAAKS